MSKMNWTRVGWEQKSRTHGSQHVADDSTLPPGVFDPYPRLNERAVEFVRAPSKSRTGAPKKKPAAPVTRAIASTQGQSGTSKHALFASPMGLIRSLESWLKRDPFMKACDDGNLVEILNALNVLRSRVDGEIRQREKMRR